MPVFKRANSPNWVIQFQFKGETYIRSSKQTNKEIAKRMEAEWKAEIHARKFLGKLEPITVEQMFQNYFNLPIARTTLKNAKSVHEMLKRFTSLEVKASEFDQSEIRKWVISRRAAGTMESTLRTHLLIISGVWNRTDKKTYDVPALEIDIPKQQLGRIDYLTPEDEDTLLSYLINRKPHAAGTGQWRNELHDVVVLLLDTGARYNEICTLRWDQIDLKAKTVDLWRQKTKSSSHLHMTNRVHQILLRRSEEKNHPSWVFTNWKKTDHRSFNTTYLNELLKKLGIDHTTHSLRHTLATKMLKNGLTLVHVQRQLGHADIKTSSRYAHLEVAEASKSTAELLNRMNTEVNRSKIRSA